MKIRTQLKAGGTRLANHNEALVVRPSLKGGRPSTGTRDGLNHNETLQSRTGLKAGRKR